MRKRWLETLYKVGRDDKRIVFVGSDLTNDELMKKYRAEIPDRFFMDGISEQHLVGMASGLAASGKIVYLNTIATFITRRCFEQNVVDLGLSNANVRLIGNGGGVVYAPLGPTHLAIEDIAIMRAIPNMTVIAPVDADEMERAVLDSINHKGPIYFRVAKGGDPVVSDAKNGFKIGQPILYREAGDVLIISTGILTTAALKASDLLKEQGIQAGVLHVHTLKPLSGDSIVSALGKAKAVITFEEHLVSGGLGSVVAEVLMESGKGRALAFKRMGLPDVFPDTYGSQASLLVKYGLSSERVVEEAKALLGVRNAL